MPKKDDDRLLLRISNKLINIGLRAPCRFNVDVYHASVTIRGNVLYEYQRRAAIQAIRSMDGVQSVIDQLKVQPPVRSWEAEAEGTSPHVLPEADPERPA